MLQTVAIVSISSFMLFFQNCGGRDYGIKLSSALPGDVINNDGDSMIVIDNPSEEDVDAGAGGGSGDTNELPGGGGSDVICDPFGGGTSGGSQNGLKASLNILKTKDELNMSQSQYDSLKTASVLNYFNPIYSQVLSQNVFFSELNVTPRRWTDGFAGASGTPMSFNGQVMNEWFGLEFDTNVQLDTIDEEGYYQIATLSDDGSLFSVNTTGSGNAYTVLVSNDNTHSPKLACAQKVIHLSQGQKVPTRIHYFQGPREHIALVVLFRKVTPNGDLAPTDKECGKVGTNYFFTNPVNGPSTALAPYIDLTTARTTPASAASPNGGWKVLSSNNYSLSNNEANPCSGQ